MAPSSDDFIRVSDIAELENFSIPELITYLKTEFRSEAYKKAAKILISREEKQNLEIKRLRTDNKRFNGLEQRYRLLLTRVAKLEEETKALSRLASHISENVNSNLDVGIGTSEKKGTTCVTKEDKIQREINGGVSDSVGIQSLHHALDEGTGSGRVEGYSGTSENKWMKCEGEEDKSERKINGRVRNSAGIQSICHTPEQGRGSERVEGPAVVTPLSKSLIKTKEELERSSTPNSGPPFATPLCKPLIKTKEEQEWSSTLKSSIGKSTPKIVVEISDSDSEKENEAIPKETFPNDVTTRTYPSPKNEENKSSSCEKFSSASTLKRKRLLRIVDTDSDDGSDNETRVERFPKKVVTKTCSSQKGDEINSSCESRRALKVTNSDSKEDDNLVTKDPPKDEISKILSGIRKWEACWKYEVDMVKSFEIDPQLCMKAVCTLYRRRLFEKKADGGSSKLNNRRFSLSCEERGTSIAKFLLDGNEEREMKKSDKELEVYDPKGLQECQKLAYHYSNQLFTIYQNREDPFFP